ncbi:MAG: hypothetical protein QOE18_865, partial [Chloroflexota bacterium]|nr:hypothetical protein [Chloroflexota bacterium]
EDGSLLSALRASRAETAITVAAVGAGAAMVVRSPALATAVLGALLLFEAFVYSNAPWASMAAEGIMLTPGRQAYARSPQNTGARPAPRRSALVVPVGVVGAVTAAAVVALIAAAPSDRAPFSGPQQDLPRIGTVAPGLGAGPTATPSPSASASPSPSPATSATPSPVASPTGTPSAAPTATPTAVPTPTAAPPTAAPSPAPT